MGNSDIMMVNPAEIIIDMPVDEQNVIQKMESMRERGIIQPVTLWLQGMRVIDGFHRSVAAQRLGWKEIPCYVVDCSEDAFWDARIQSARQHHKIENERLICWMLESWRMTRWCRPETMLLPDGKYSPEFASLAETLWAISLENNNSLLRFMGKVEIQDDELRAWVDDKSRKWSITSGAIVEAVLAHCGLGAPRNIFDQLGDDLARMHKLSSAQAIKVKANAGFGECVPLGKIADEWLATEVLAKEKPMTYVDFARMRDEQEMEAESVKKRKEMEQQVHYRQTPQGQVEAHRRKVQTVKEAADRAVYAIQSIEHLLTDSQDFSLPIAEAISSLVAFHNEHFTKKATALKDSLSAKNAKLRKELKEVTAERDSLKRALESKNNLTSERLKNVLAYQ